MHDVTLSTTVQYHIQSLLILTISANEIKGNISKLLRNTDDRFTIVSNYGSLSSEQKFFFGQLETRIDYGSHAHSTFHPIRTKQGAFTEGLAFIHHSCKVWLQLIQRKRSKCELLRMEDLLQVIAIVPLTPWVR